MTLARKAFSGSLWTSGISYLGFAVNLCTQLILVRLLIPDDFGLFVLGFSMAEILFIFFSFSFSMSIIQIQDAEDLFDTAYYLALFSGFIILLLGGIVGIVMPSYYPMSAVMVFIVLCAVQPIQGCALIYAASLEKEMQFKRNAIAGSVASNIAAIISVGLAYTGFGVWSLVWKEIIKVTLLLFLTRFSSNYRFKGKFNRETAMKLWSFGFKMIFSKGMGVIYYRAPQFIIGSFAGTAALGLFSQTYYIASIPYTVLLPTTSRVSYPIYSKLQDHLDKMSNAFYITNYFFIRILFPLMLVLFLYPKDVILLLYGDRWIEASQMLRCFALYAAFVPLFSNAKTLSYGLGRLLEVNKAYLIKIVLLTVGLIIALTVNYMHLGAVSYSVSVIGGLIAVSYFLKKEGIKLEMQKLFVVPVSVSVIVAFIWPLIADNMNIDFSENNAIRFIFLLMLYCLFAVVIFLSETKLAITNVKYLQNKFASVKQ